MQIPLRHRFLCTALGEELAGSSLSSLVGSKNQQQISIWQAGNISLGTAGRGCSGASSLALAAVSLLGNSGPKIVSGVQRKAHPKLQNSPQMKAFGGSQAKAV